MVNRLYIEKRTVKRKATPLRDIAHHLYVRYRLGKVVIICSKPEAVLPNLRREWFAIERFVRRERATTMQPALAQELLSTAASMRELKFSVNIQHRDADVHLVTAANCIQAHLTCWTLYMLEPVGDDALQQLVHSVEENGLMVSYTDFSSCNWQQFV